MGRERTGEICRAVEWTLLSHGYLVAVTGIRRSAPSSQGTHHPVKPRKYVTRPLKPNHLAVLQDKFRFHRGHKHYFPRHLYGPPGLLRTHAPKLNKAGRASFTYYPTGQYPDSPLAIFLTWHIRTIFVRLPVRMVPALTLVRTAQPAVFPRIPASGGSLSALQMGMGGPGINTTVTSHSTEGYYFVQQSESGDFSLTAQDSGQTSSGSSPYFNEGVMLRAGTGSAKAFYYAYVVGTNGTTLQGGIYVDYMSANGGSPTNLAMIPVSGQALPGSSSAAATCNAGGSATC